MQMTTGLDTAFVSCCLKKTQTNKTKPCLIQMLTLVADRVCELFLSPFSKLSSQPYEELNQLQPGSLKTDRSQVFHPRVVYKLGTYKLVCSTKHEQRCCEMGQGDFFLFPI